jgi:hypothetical protein
VGALALAASIYNVYLQRAQIRAQVWPHLTWSYNNVEGFSYNLENSGVGPAIVKGIRINVDGKSVKSWNEAFTLLASRDPALDALLSRHELTHSHGTVHVRVVGVGVEAHAVQFGGLSDEEMAPLKAVPKHIDALVCYCSTLDDCWVTSGFVAQPVASCPMESLTFED